MLSPLPRPRAAGPLRGPGPGRYAALGRDRVAVRLCERGFTLIELLVVVAIIAVLLAIISPAMDKAVDTAQKAKCLANQRNMVQGCHQYALQYRGVLPIYPPGEANPSAYDWRSPWNGSPKGPGGFGHLPAGGFLPTTQLGEVIHCPFIDNTGATDGTTDFYGIGMDRTWLSNSGAGGSWWVDPTWTDKRIMGSYNYRGASWRNSGKGLLRLSKIGPDTIISIDLPDMRFGGLRYIHPDGYNRAFGDLHGGFFHDPQGTAEQRILAYTAGAKDVAGHTPQRAQSEETLLYPYLERDLPTD